uniref:Transcription factor domain-containing protein n=1 Tax=Colletotrichum fructicola (strain Nara gc5) TaxID=1213859 RepID=L2FRD7_COLFN
MPTDAEYGRLVTLNETATSLNADVIPMPSYRIRTAADLGQPVNIVSEFDTFSASMNPTGVEGAQAWNSAFVSFNQPFPWSFTENLFNHELPGSVPSSVLHSNGVFAQGGATAVSRYIDPIDGLGPSPGGKPCASCEDIPSFPSLELYDEDTLLAEDFRHVSKINGYERLAQFFQEQSPSGDQVFPEARVIHTFVQLYYEHFDFQFPFIHPAMIETGDESWVSVLAVASIGSQYSSISNSEQYSKGLQELLGRAVAVYKPEPHRTPSLHIVQGTLISLVCLQFSGSQRGSMRAQWQRSQLISLCRFVVGLADWNPPQTTNKIGEVGLPPSREFDWSIAFTYFAELECLQLSFLSLPPIYKLHELTDRFPAHELVWKCRDAERWRVEIRAAGRIGLDLSNKHDVVTKMGSFARQMHMLSLYTEEKFLHYQLSSPIWKTLMAGMSNPVDTQPNINTLLTNAATSVNDAFETLRGIDNSRSESPESDALYTYYHVLSILRQVPLRKLYEFSGWQVTEPQIEAAREYLQKWMRNKPSHARKCLWHAAVVFKILRNKKHFSCDSPFCMLVVALYIWAFDQFAQPKENMSPGDAVNCVGTDRPTRVDLLQDEKEIEEWLENGSSSVHITGVGVLKSTKSGARMISECRRILLSASGWSPLCSFLAGAWERVSGGGRPHDWSEA